MNKIKNIYLCSSVGALFLFFVFVFTFFLCVKQVSWDGSADLWSGYSRPGK